MINKPMLNKQTTGFRFIPFLRIPRNIPVSIPECPNSAGMIRHRNDENSRPSCQISFLRNPPDSAGMTGFLQELGGHCKDLSRDGVLLSSRVNSSSCVASSSRVGCSSRVTSPTRVAFSLCVASSSPVASCVASLCVSPVFTCCCHRTLSVGGGAGEMWRMSHDDSRNEKM